MKNYIIPVFGPCKVDRERWGFAFNALGYRMPTFRSLTVTEPTTIHATSKSGGAEDTLQKGNDVLVFETDAPEVTVEAFWSMTGQVCGFIGVTNDTVKTLDDVVRANIKLTR